MNNTSVTTLSIVALLLVITVALWGCPAYKVYSSRKNGEAELAQADTIRAHGIAASNRIIGMSLENNPSYLYWKFIDELKETQNQLIYIPSGQLGMPIMEAGRFGKPQKTEQ